MTVELSPPDDWDTAAPAVIIDCQDRVDLCRAACCRLRFALSPQDVAAGGVPTGSAAPVTALP